MQDIVELLLAIEVKLFLSPDVSEEYIFVDEVVWARYLVPFSLHGLLLCDQFLYVLLQSVLLQTFLLKFHAVLEFNGFPVLI